MDARPLADALNAFGDSLFRALATQVRYSCKCGVM